MRLIDCFVLHGVIFVFPSRQVGNNLIVPGGSRLIDARGKFVIPGWFLLSFITFPVRAKENLNASSFFE